MPTLRRLLLCSALLIGFILLGAQALGMLAAHRYLNAQLARQSEAGANALAWALSHGSGSPQEQSALVDDLFKQDLYALVSITNEGSAAGVERRAGPDGGGGERDWRGAWLNIEAPAVTLPFATADGRAKGSLTVQANARLARDTLWQGGVRVLGLVLPRPHSGCFSWPISSAGSRPAPRGISATACARWRRAPTPGRPGPAKWRGSIRPWSMRNAWWPPR